MLSTKCVTHSCLSIQIYSAGFLYGSYSNACLAAPAEFSFVIWLIFSLWNYERWLHMQKGAMVWKANKTRAKFLWIEVMVRVWSLLYAQLHKNYLERYFISIRHAHTRPTHTFRLLHSCVLSPYSFTLSECERTTKNTRTGKLYVLPWKC